MGEGLCSATEGLGPVSCPLLALCDLGQITFPLWGFQFPHLWEERLELGEFSLSNHCRNSASLWIFLNRQGLALEAVGRVSSMEVGALAGLGICWEAS